MGLVSVFCSTISYWPVNRLVSVSCVVASSYLYMQKKSQSAEDNENAALVLDMLETLDANLLKVGHNTKSCLN